MVEKYNPEMSAKILGDFARRCQKPQMPAMLRKIFNNPSGTTKGGIILPAGMVEINIDLCRIQRIAGKIARGALFLSAEKYVPEDNIVDMRICPEESEVPEMYQISWKCACSIEGQDRRYGERGQGGICLCLRDDGFERVGLFRRRFRERFGF